MLNGDVPTLEAALGDRYRIRQTLGGGGMSATYIVDEIALGRPVVLKTLPPTLATHLSTERFEREIQLAARLQHAFIVPLLSAGIADGSPWYTMPLVQGESLRARLAREGAMPAMAAARILRDVAEALAYAHGQGVIHRDIKPDNILLSGAHALVTDFGVAKALAASGANGSTMTEVGIALGTPAYMAPEQAAADTSIDHRADLYSLGAMGYEMLCGRPMFGDRSPMQMLAAHATEKPASLASAVPGAPADLVTLIERLVAKHPNDRPSRAQDVADALAAMIGRWSSGETPRSRGMLSARTAFALWSAAFVGLGGAAWLAVRWLPIPAWTFPATVLVMLAGLPMIALAAWLHRPARAIASTPSVSSTTTLGTIEALARPHLNPRRALRYGLTGIALVALLAAAWGASRALGIGPAATLRSRGVVAADTRILVSDFAPPPSDTSLGSIVTDLLRTEISRSPSVRLLSANTRNLALLAMGKPAGTRIAGDVAAEVATRANAAVRIDGSVAQLGAGYLVRSTLVENATGREIASFHESANTVDGIISAVDRLGRAIRDELGVSLREIRSAPPLYFALTPSLEALRLYTAATKAAERADFPTAIAQLELAVAADTEFAEGYRRLASFAQNIGDLDRAVWASERAFRYRERLPRRFQRLVEGTYYSAPTGGYDLNKAIAAYQAALEEAPGGTAVLNNLGLVHYRNRQADKALEYFERDIAIDTTTIFGPQNIADAYYAAGERDAGRRYIEAKLARWQPYSAATKGMIANMLVSDHLLDSAGHVLEQSIGGGGADAQRRLRPILAHVHEAQGRASRVVVDLTGLPANDSSKAIRIVILERARMLVGALDRPRDAVTLLDSAVHASPPPTNTTLNYPWLTLAQLYARAGDASHAKQMIDEFDRRATPGARRFNAQQIGLAQGWLAIGRHQYGEAVKAFRDADVGECLVCALPPLAISYDLAGQADSAIAVFERYLSTSFLRRVATDAEYLPETYKRLGELYERKGDTAKAREYYERFVELWKHADAELQPQVRDVRKRLDVLRARER